MRLHLAPDRQPRQHHTTLFLQAGCPSCRPTNSVKALKAKPFLLVYSLIKRCRFSADRERVLYDGEGEHQLRRRTRATRWRRSSRRRRSSSALRSHAGAPMREAKPRLPRLQLRRPAHTRRPVLGSAHLRLRPAGPAALRHPAVPRRRHSVPRGRAPVPSRYISAARSATSGHSNGSKIRIATCCPLANSIELKAKRGNELHAKPHGINFGLVFTTTGVTSGPRGPSPLQWPNKNFFVKIEGLLEPVVLNLTFRVRSNAMFTSERRY